MIDGNTTLFITPYFGYQIEKFVYINQDSIKFPLSLFF